MRTRRSGIQTDDGFTLVEVLVAMVILGSAVSALVAALGTTANASDRHRKLSTAETVLRTYAEAVEGATYQGNCTTAQNTSYKASTFAITAPTGYSISSPVVKTLAGATCTNGLSIQKITLTVQSSDGRASETVDVVKYQP